MDDDIHENTLRRHSLSTSLTLLNHNFHGQYECNSFYLSKHAQCHF